MSNDDTREAIGANGGPAMFVGGEGWVAIHRNMRAHWLVGFGQNVKPADPKRGSLSRAEAWIDLIMECRYEAGTVNNGGRKMRLDPGQLLGAVSWLGKRWNWTPQTVRTFLDKLEGDGMIDRAAPVDDGGANKHNGKQSNIVTVCNYSSYQVAPGTGEQAQQQASNKHATSTQQASNNNIKDNKETREQEKEPPTPLGGASSVSDLKPETAKADKVRELFGDTPAEPPKAETEKREVEEAFAIYNLAAAHFGFAKCGALTQARRTRLGKRLADVGGLDGFKVALRALAKADPFTQFLRGKSPPRPGEKPFKLDIDRLMQTEGNLGDVLAKLWDLGDVSTSGSVPAQRFWQDPASLAAITVARWRELVAQHLTGNIWPIKDLGPAPGSPRCVIPPEVVAEFKLAERFDDRGVQRISWGKK